nr:unnamed protein product [Digitaria exilis]
MPMPPLPPEGTPHSAAGGGGVATGLPLIGCEMDPGPLYEAVVVVVGGEGGVEVGGVGGHRGVVVRWHSNFRLPPPLSPPLAPAAAAVSEDASAAASAGLSFVSSFKPVEEASGGTSKPNSRMPAAAAPAAPGGVVGCCGGLSRAERMNGSCEKESMLAAAALPLLVELPRASRSPLIMSINPPADRSRSLGRGRGRGKERERER